MYHPYIFLEKSGTSGTGGMFTPVFRGKVVYHFKSSKWYIQR